MRLHAGRSARTVAMQDVMGSYTLLLLPSIGTSAAAATRRWCGLGAWQRPDAAGGLVGGGESAVVRAAAGTVHGGGGEGRQAATTNTDARRRASHVRDSGVARVRARAWRTIYEEEEEEVVGSPCTKDDPRGCSQQSRPRG